MRRTLSIFLGLASGCSTGDLDLVLRESVYVEIVEMWVEVQNTREMAQQVRADDKQLEALQEVIRTASTGALDGEIDIDEVGTFIGTIREALKDDVVESSEVTRVWDTLRTVYRTDAPRPLVVRNP